MENLLRLRILKDNRLDRRRTTHDPDEKNCGNNRFDPGRWKSLHTFFFGCTALLVYRFSLLLSKNPRFIRSVAPFRAIVTASTQQ